MLFYEDKLELDKVIAIFIQGNPWDNLVSALKIIDVHVLCISQFQAPTPPPREFFEVGKRPAPGQIFSEKARPPGQENTYPQGVF